MRVSRVYRVGYGNEFGQSDAGVTQALYEHSANALQPLYEPHLASDDARREHVVLLLDRIQKGIANLAARHLHGQAFDPEVLGEHSRGNWYDLLADYWSEAIEMYSDVPDASVVWQRESALLQGALGKKLGEALLSTLGYGWADREVLAITADEATIAARVDRFKAESDAMR